MPLNKTWVLTEITYSDAVDRRDYDERPIGVTNDEDYARAAKAALEDAVAKAGSTTQYDLYCVETLIL